MLGKVVGMQMVVVGFLAADVDDESMTDVEISIMMLGSVCDNDQKFDKFVER